MKGAAEGFSSCSTSSQDLDQLTAQIYTSIARCPDDIGLGAGQAQLGA